MSTVALSEGQQVTLTLASDLAVPGEALFPLDRIRLQKAVFLICMRGPERWGDVYTFRPYDWGPYSDQLTSDVALLSAAELMRFQKANNRYVAHAATPQGNEVALVYWLTLGASEQNFLRAVRSYVTKKSFRDLLREVYAAYPQYASNSRFVG